MICVTDYSREIPARVSLRYNGNAFLLQFQLNAALFACYLTERRIQDMTGRPIQAEFLTTSVLEPLARKWKSTASREITRQESYCRAMLRMPRHINCQVLLGRKHRVHYFETAMQHKIVKRCEINQHCLFTRPGIVLCEEVNLSSQSQSRSYFHVRVTHVVIPITFTFSVKCQTFFVCTRLSKISGFLLASISTVIYSNFSNRFFGQTQ